MEYVDGDKLTYQELIHGALKGMLGTLDPHSEFMDPTKFDELKKDTEGEFGGVGIIVQMGRDKYLTVVTPMEDSPGFKAGILPLDRILKIDGKSTEKFDARRSCQTLARRAGHRSDLSLIRPSTGQIKDYKLRPRINQSGHRQGHQWQARVSAGRGPHRLYSHLTQFGEKTSTEMDAGFKKLQDEGMKALILDLRDNPGGLLEQAGQVCEKFVPRGQLIVSTEGRGPSPNSEYRANGHGKQLDLPMVVLVNIGSASAAEIVAGCLQDLQPQTHAIVVGEQTFGKGSVQSILPLPDGSALRLTTAKYYTPSHKVIHEHGITPDIIVPMTDAEEYDLYRKRTPGALETLDDKDRERVEKVHEGKWSAPSMSSKAFCSTRSAAWPPKVAAK